MNECIICIILFQISKVSILQRQVHTSNAGAATCRLDVSLDLFHSLSLASKPSTSPYPQPIATAPMAAAPSTSAMALAETLALRVKELLGNRWDLGWFHLWGHKGTLSSKTMDELSNWMPVVGDPSCSQEFWDPSCSEKDRCCLVVWRILPRYTLPNGNRTLGKVWKRWIYDVCLTWICISIWLFFKPNANVAIKSV